MTGTGDSGFAPVRAPGSSGSVSYPKSKVKILTEHLVFSLGEYLKQFTEVSGK